MLVDVDTSVYMPVDVDTVGSLHHSASPGHNPQLLQPTVV